MNKKRARTIRRQQARLDKMPKIDYDFWLSEKGIMQRHALFNNR